MNKYVGNIRNNIVYSSSLICIVCSICCGCTVVVLFCFFFLVFLIFRCLHKDANACKAIFHSIISSFAECKYVCRCRSELDGIFEWFTILLTELYIRILVVYLICIFSAYGDDPKSTPVPIQWDEFVVWVLSHLHGHRSSVCVALQY